MGKFTKILKPGAAFGSGVGTGAVIEENVPEAEKLSVYAGMSGAGMAASEAAKSKKLKKLLTGKIGKKLATMPLKALTGPASLGFWAKDLYELLGPAISKAMAKDIGKLVGQPELTPKKYREMIGSYFKPKHRVREGSINPRTGKPRKTKFLRSKKDILKSIGRKKGGRVSKPKGVGVAKRGYGKAMKRGKQSKHKPTDYEAWIKKEKET